MKRRAFSLHLRVSQLSLLTALLVQRPPRDHPEHIRTGLKISEQIQEVNMPHLSRRPDRHDNLGQACFLAAGRLPAPVFANSP